MDLLTAVISVPAQVAVFGLFPLAWWLQAGRPDGSFLRWLGFGPSRPDVEPAAWAVLTACLLGFFGIGRLGAAAARTPSGDQVSVLLAITLTAVLQTALAEELFFRGFLLRWLTERRGAPIAANVVQAVICGLLGSVVQWFFVDRALLPCLAAFALSAGSAFLAGWLKQHSGSLLLPWAAHGAGNLAAGLVAVLGR